MLLARNLEEPIGSDHGHDQSYLNNLDFSWVLILPVENSLMARPLAKSPLILLALGFWILACAASLAKVDDPTR